MKSDSTLMPGAEHLAKVVQDHEAVAVDVTAVDEPLRASHPVDIREQRGGCFARAFDYDSAGKPGKPQSAVAVLHNEHRLRGVAQLMAVASTVYELTNKGELEHTRIGSRKYVSRQSIMAFIKQNTHRGYYAG